MIRQTALIRDLAGTQGRESTPRLPTDTLVSLSASIRQGKFVLPGRTTTRTTTEAAAATTTPITLTLSTNQGDSSNPPNSTESLQSRASLSVIESRLVIDASALRVIQVFTRQGRSESRSVNAEVAEEFEENIMSYGMARNLPISTFERKDGDPISIGFIPGGERRIIGKTEPAKLFTAAMYRWVSLTFWVYEEHQPRMILGRPFMERRYLHYRNDLAA